MPRKKLEVSKELPYHITARANNRDAFSLPLPQMWKILGQECLNLTWVYGAQIQALVLMPNHFHLIMTSPEHDLGKAMSVFLSSVTRTSNLHSGRSGHVFGGPYYWSLITSTRYYGHALKYVYRNPVKANICQNVEDYPFSTLSGLIGSEPLQFPIHPTQVGMEVNLPPLDSFEQLRWLNFPFPAEADALVQKGLKKRIFDSVIDRRTQMPSQLLAQLL